MVSKAVWSKAAIFFFCFISVCLFNGGALANDDSKEAAEEEMEQELNHMLQPQPGHRECPLPLVPDIIGVGTKCPESNQIFYFDCCGNGNTECCFHLQPATWFAVGLLLVLLLCCGLLCFFCGLIRCLLDCCCQCRPQNPRPPPGYVYHR